MTQKDKIKQTELLIPIWTKKYSLIITNEWKIIDNTEVVHIFCKWANIDQDYPKEDIPLLLEDIVELIEMEQSQNKVSNICIRVRPSQKLQIEKNAAKNWYKSVSEFMISQALISKK